MVVAKVWIMRHKFVGFPKPSDFAIEKEPLPQIKHQEALLEALWWSADPYNRAFAAGFRDNTPMIGFQVGRVIESKSTAYPLGAVVVAHCGWRTHSIISSADSFRPYVLQDDLFKGLPVSLSVGCMGMPGITAYFGLVECCKPKAGDTLLVNAAAGAVGSLVGQIGKIKGCRVIGYAGSDEKVEYIKSIGFDHAYNYKTVDLDKSLKEAAPNGVDCFFDNVGGQFAVTVYNHLADGGRVCKCGSISTYNVVQKPRLPNCKSILNGKHVQLNDFSSFAHADRFPEGIQQMSEWIHTGKIKYHETINKGFEQMPQALIDLLNGVNIGKVVICA